MKLSGFMIIFMLTAAYAEGKAALRRKPKVYNALITTDEDLVQSRAFPVIQPTIHESGIAHYPFNPYGVFNQHVIRLGQPIAPALKSKQQQPYTLPSAQFPPQLIQQPLIPQPFTGYPLPQHPPTAPELQKVKESSITPTGSEDQSPATVEPPALIMPAASAELHKDPEEANKMPLEPLPIPLNQQGLPPALIPLRQPRPYPPQAYPLPNGLQPFHLPPYRFNPFPPAYFNTLPGLRQPFLPPYNYLPTGPQFPLSNIIPTDKTYPQVPSLPLPAPTAAPHTSPPTSPLPPLAEETTDVPSSTNPVITEPAFENIKNGSKSKDSNVPDVPPPPIPSGAKSEQP